MGAQSWLYASHSAHKFKLSILSRISPSRFLSGLDSLWFCRSWYFGMSRRNLSTQDVDLHANISPLERTFSFPFVAPISCNTCGFAGQSVSALRRERIVISKKNVDKNRVRFSIESGLTTSNVRDMTIST